MKYKFPYSDLDLYHTLISGQTFEWFYESNVWKGTIYNNPVTLKQNGTTKEGFLEYEADQNLDEEINLYFGLDENYSELISQISFDNHIHKSLGKLYGLRVIRQDPWFCINSFILSSNNTVKNIQNILKNISVAINGYDSPTDYYNFPSFDKLKDISEFDLRNCKAGFRAKYLIDFYNKIKEEENFIKSIENLSYTEAKEKLMSVKGIGEKVADCILLYAYRQYEAYPLDTHLRKATHEGYFSHLQKPPSDKKLREWSKEYWGGYAGFAHFFLFTYHRLYGKL